MNDPLFSTDNLIDSVLCVKASGSIADVSADFDAVPTKTIAELITDETEKKEINQETN